MRRLSASWRTAVSGQVTSQHRGAAQYGVTLLSHGDLLAKYGKTQTSTQDETATFDRVLDNLERVEQRLANWKLQKWEFRVPVLLTAAEKQKSLAQLARLKSEIRLRLIRQEDSTKDLQLVSRLTNTPVLELRYKTRAWIGEKVQTMRFNGEIGEAKAIREAWMRLEENGGREFELLERLCCVYGLARMGTFESAFENLIVPKVALENAEPKAGVSKFSGKSYGGRESSTNEVELAFDERNAFITLLTDLAAHFPTLDLLYDFLGYNVTEGYQGALIRLLQMSLRHKNGEETNPHAQLPTQGVLYQRTITEGVARPTTEFLYNCAGSNAPKDIPLPDLIYGNGTRLVCISIANPNRYLREIQLPYKKQMEGMARRLAFVFGYDFDDVAVQNLLLPPEFMDKDSFGRLSRVIGSDFHPSVQSWMQHYSKELGMEEKDYATQAKTYPEDEWVRL